MQVSSVSSHPGAAFWLPFRQQCLSGKLLVLLGVLRCTFKALTKALYGKYPNAIRWTVAPNQLHRTFKHLQPTWTNAHRNSALQTSKCLQTLDINKPYDAVDGGMAERSKAWIWNLRGAGSNPAGGRDGFFPDQVLAILNRGKWHLLVIPSYWRGNLPWRRPGWGNNCPGEQPLSQKRQVPSTSPLWQCEPPASKCLPALTDKKQKKKTPYDALSKKKERKKEEEQNPLSSQYDNRDPNFCTANRDWQGEERADKGYGYLCGEAFAPKFSFTNIKMSLSSRHQQTMWCGLKRKRKVERIRAIPP